MPNSDPRLAEPVAASIKSDTDWRLMVGAGGSQKLWVGFEHGLYADRSRAFVMWPLYDLQKFPDDGLCR